MWTLPWRVYTNEDKTEILNPSDDGAVLLGGEWDRIEHDVARRLGLVDEAGKTHSPTAIRRRQAREARQQVAAETAPKEVTDGQSATEA